MTCTYTEVSASFLTVMKHSFPYLLFNTLQSRKTMVMAELEHWGPCDPQIIRFRCIHLKDDDLYDLLPFIMSVKDEVYEIDLKYNLISDEGAKLIGKILKHLPKLARICLASNLIGDEGISNLVDSILQHGKQIVQLHLEGNRIGTRGSWDIICLINEHPSMRVLSVQENKWVKEDTNKVIAALVENETLAGIFLSIKSADELLKMDGIEDLLEQNTTLFHLYYASALNPPFFPSLICECDEAADVWKLWFSMMWKLVILCQANLILFSNV